MLTDLSLGVRSKTFTFISLNPRGQEYTKHTPEGNYSGGT